MSVQAISWVLEDAPDVPVHLVSTLLALANHADRHGRGAYPDQETVAWYTRKSDRAIRNDLVELRKRGLIREGDQRLVSHIPADERPVVYDLALDQPKRIRPPKKRKDRKHTSARKPEGTGSTLPTEQSEGPEAHFRPEADFRPNPRDRKSTSAGNRGNGHLDRKYSSEGTGSPLPTNRPLNQNPLSPQVDARSAIAVALDVDERESEQILELIRTECRPRSELGFVRHLIANGDIHSYAARVREQAAPAYTGPTHDWQADASGNSVCCPLPETHPRHRKAA